MTRARVEQTFKLQLLALMLALALVWYSINPAPSLVKRVKKADELPDVQEHGAEFRLQRTTRAPDPFEPQPGGGQHLLISNSDVDALDWPEFIND